MFVTSTDITDNFCGDISVRVELSCQSVNEVHEVIRLLNLMSGIEKKGNRTVVNKRIANQVLNFDGEIPIGEFLDTIFPMSKPKIDNSNNSSPMENFEID